MQAAEQAVLEHGVLRSDLARLLGPADSSNFEGERPQIAQQVEVLCCVKQQIDKTEEFLLIDPRSLCGTSLGHGESSGLGDIMGQWVVIGDVTVKRRQGCILPLQPPTLL